MMMMFHLIWRLKLMSISIHIQRDTKKKTDVILKPMTCINLPLVKFKRKKVWLYPMVLPSYRVSCGKIIPASSQWILRVKKMQNWLIQLSLLISRIRILQLILKHLRNRSFKRLKFSKMKTNAHSSNLWLFTKVTE